MKPEITPQFERLPKKNIEETQRPLGNLKDHLREIDQRVEDIQLEGVRKKLNEDKE